MMLLLFIIVFLQPYDGCMARTTTPSSTFWKKDLDFVGQIQHGGSSYGGGGGGGSSPFRVRPSVTLAQNTKRRKQPTSSIYNPRTRELTRTDPMQQQQEQGYTVYEYNDDNTSSSSGRRDEAVQAMDSFLTRDSRQTFISRVYAILSVQLMITTLSIYMFGTNPSWGQFMKTQGTYGPWLPTISMIVSLVSYMTMCNNHQSQYKWHMLSFFTIAESLIVGFISSFYTYKSVITAMLSTFVAAASVSFYTWRQRNSKYDLSQWGTTLSSFGLIFMAYSFLVILMATGVLPPNFLPYTDVMYGMIGSTLFSGYLAYHTRTIVGGKYTKHTINENDYVFGAMTLYNDIVSLFVYILKIVGDDPDH